MQELADQLIAKDRRALARAITLVESSRDADRRMAQDLLKILLPHTGRSVRIGISGVPGVGKSTFIEAYGMRVIERSNLAVLAVDPSSQLSGGSILGDKTRMQKLGRSERAFIRPSPSGGALGGVARRTREAILLCEAAGYDVIFVETVGVGQSEVEVASMTDFFLLLSLPNAGDELQGIKKGVLELVDAVIVNKADTDKEAALRTQGELRSAIHYMRARTPGWAVPILLASGLQGTGLEELDATIEKFLSAVGRGQSGGFFETRRREQNRSWMRSLLSEEILRRFEADPLVERRLPELERLVVEGETTPVLAVLELIALHERG